MSNAIKALVCADDFAVVRAMEFFLDEVSEEINRSAISKDELLALASTAEGLDGIGDLLENKMILSASDTVKIVRKLFAFAAENKQAKFVEHCLKDWPDERQSVGEILAVGTVAAALLLILTTSISYRDGQIVIEKTVVIPQKMVVKAGDIRGEIEMALANASQPNSPAKAMPKKKP